MSEETEADLLEQHINAHLADAPTDNEEATETPVESKVEATEESNEGKEKPKKSRNQNAKARLRRKLREEQDRNAQILEENKKLMDKFSALEQKVDGVINPPAPRPDRVDFDTEEAYEDALYDWRAEKTSTQEPVEKQDPNPAPQNDIVPTDVRQNWNSQMDSGVEKYDDFEQAISNPELAMTDSMTFAVMESDVGGDIAYFLGKNLSEADRISRLGIAAQVREIDRIGEKFRQHATKAPDPIDPVSGKGDHNSEQVDPLLKGATFT